MKFFKGLTIAFILLIFAVPTMAGNTVNSFESCVQVSAMDGDWLWSTITTNPKGIKIKAIKFYPGAADDVLIIKNGSDSGPTMLKLESSDGEPRYDPSFAGGYFKPVIDYGDCTLTGTASIVFILP